MSSYALPPKIKLSMLKSNPQKSKGGGNLPPPLPKQEEIEKEFVEKGADLEHQRWARWQAYCHRILRENCSSIKLEEVLARWDRQIATPYSELSEQEKESDRKETRNYLPLLEAALQAQKAEILGKVEKMKFKPIDRARNVYHEDRIKFYNKAIQDIIKLLEEKKKIL